MKTIMLLSLILFVGCASSGKKGRINPDDVENKDFKKVKPVRYNSDNDYFKKVDSIDTAVLNDESMARLDDFSDVSDEDVFTEIAKNCYEKEYDTAWEVIRENHDKFRTNPAFWNQVGNCYLRRNEFRKALLYYNKSLEFKSNYVPALNNVGVMYWKKNELQKALVAFKKARDGDRFAKTPRFNLAMLYLQHGLSDKAIKTLNSLINLGKTDVDVRSGLASAFAMNKDYNRAISYCKDLSSHFNKAHVGVSCAMAYFNKGDKEKASDVISKVDEDRLGPWKSYYKEVRKKVK
jgi:tetratricopeptide (TPR) repeat protein